MYEYATAHPRVCSLRASRAPLPQGVGTRHRGPAAKNREVFLKCCNVLKGTAGRIAGKSLLLVEDSEDEALLTQRALKKAGIANGVVWVRDGAEALHYLHRECLDAGAPLPRLMLLDIKLPRLDGFGVLRAIRDDDRLKGMPVVMFSSSTEDRDVLESYRSGANGYVCKPVDSREYDAVLCSISSFWLIVNRCPPAVC